MTSNLNDLRSLDPEWSERIRLSDGFSVTREFLELVRFCIEDRLHELSIDKAYKAKQLTGPEFWGGLDVGDRRVAGRCIAYLTSHGRLPLTLVKWKHEFPLKYRLK
jgi:hypothetical protein